MNENNKSNISKNDLLNVREMIEKEMHQEATDPLFLTDICAPPLQYSKGSKYEKDPPVVDTNIVSFVKKEPLTKVSS